MNDFNLEWLKAVNLVTLSSCLSPSFKSLFCCLLCCHDDVARRETGLLRHQQQSLTSSEECAAAVAAAATVLMRGCSPSWPLTFTQRSATHITLRSQLIHCSLLPSFVRYYFFLATPALRFYHWRLSLICLS